MSAAHLSLAPEDEEYYKRFGYTWLTHIRLAEEDNMLRQQIAEMRGRGRGRHGRRYDGGIGGGSGSSGSSSSSDESDDELVFGDDIEAKIGAPSPLSPSSPPSSLSSEDPSGELEWLSSQNEVISTRQTTRASSIVPLWISVHVDEESKTASLYESVVPVESNVVEKLEMKDSWRPFYVVRLEEEEADRNRYRAYGLEPDERVPRLTFEEYPELTAGSWRNYFVGIWGDVAALDEGTLWPNRVLHKDRCVFNVRNGLDLVRFLADPRKKDIEDHARNLERLANGGVEVVEPAPGGEETMSSWEWGLLKPRWGSHGLKKHGFM